MLNSDTNIVKGNYIKFTFFYRPFHTVFQNNLMKWYEDNVFEDSNEKMFLKRLYFFFRYSFQIIIHALSLYIRPNVFNKVLLMYCIVLLYTCLLSYKMPRTHLLQKGDFCTKNIAQEMHRLYRFLKQNWKHICFL